MLLSNVGNRIVSVGLKVLMPGDTMEISKELAESKPIVALIKYGFLKVTEIPGTNTVDAVVADAKEPDKKTRRSKVAEQV